MPLAVAMKRVVQSLGGKRATKKNHRDLYWEMQWLIGKDEER